MPQNTPTDVYLYTAKLCDFCKLVSDREVTATHDGKVIGQSAWAYMCDEHFKAMGVGLGTGVGQRLHILPAAPD